jgi:tetratricopeptide (TPR) repeat protein
MPREKQRSLPDEEASRMAHAFQHRVSEALEHFADAAWLGARSPLATPYVLGEWLLGHPGGDTALGRGRALQRAILEVASELHEQGRPVPEWEHFAAAPQMWSAQQRLLYWSFFAGYFQGKASLSIERIIAELGVSRATYYRLLPRAVEQLAAALIRRITPSLRLENPSAPQALVGRASELELCITALQMGLMVVIEGPAGSGKTALGTSVITALASLPTFWFTLRPGLNDRLGSLAFALSHFLQRQGRTAAWLQIVADQGQVKLEIVAGLIRHDLEQLPLRPLLCFDELDLLHPGELAAHEQLLAFIESLHGLVPMLLIGQRVPLIADRRVSLGGLGVAAVTSFWEAAGLQIDAAMAERLTALSGGNPRLLELFLSLQILEGPTESALAQFATMPALDGLVRRIWRRLDAAEQRLLLLLAVFHGPAPSDAFEDQLVEQLVERHLVQRDTQGGVLLHPAYAGVIAELPDPETRDALHLEAAAISAQRGAYTAAANHLLRANQPRLAIWTWYSQRVQEINQGQAASALDLFSRVSASRLEGADREVLLLLRAELYKLLGEHERAAETLKVGAWQSRALRARASQIEGELADLRDEFAQATDAYRAGLESLAPLLGSTAAQLRISLGRVAMRQNELEQAWNEARLARYEIEKVQGQIKETLGEYDAALTHYRAALVLAEEHGHGQNEAKAHDNLAAIFALRGAYEQAHHHWERACTLLERVGNLDALATVRVNQAFGYNLAGHAEAAVAAAEAALGLFRRLGEPAGCAVAAQNLAEAYLSMGQLDTAEGFAQQVIAAEDTGTLPDGLRVLGEIQLARGQFDAAEALLRQSINAADKNRDMFLAAYGWRALARLLRQQARLPEAEAARAQAVAHFTDLGLERELARLD